MKILIRNSFQSMKHCEIHGRSCLCISFIDDFVMKDEFVQKMFGPAHPNLRSLSVVSKFS